VSNTLEFSKNNHGNVVATVRSPNERDLSAVIDDPTSHILTVANLAGLQVSIGGQPMVGLPTDEPVEVDLSQPQPGEPQIGSDHPDVIEAEAEEVDE
jgi:hypothetical protein